MSNILTQMTGNIEKARILIMEPQETQVELQPPVSVVGTGGGGPLLDISATGTIKQMAEQGLQQGKQMVSKALGIVTNKLAEAHNYQEYIVQFNPNQLTLSGYGGGMFQKTDYGSGKSTGEKGGLSFEEASVRLTLEVPLIFDQVTPKDAFMSDKFAASPSGAVTGVAQLAKKAIGKNVYSVQPIVEGFIAMLRCAGTRRIVFTWGEMYYGGILSNVGSNYTMFSVSGQPIRAEVRLSLTLIDEGVDQLDMGQWGTSFEKAFGNGSFKNKNIGQKVGNLFNI